MSFTLPGTTDVGYLAELKATMVEVAGHRLYDYRGCDRLREYLKWRGYTAAGGFPDNPTGCPFPAETDGVGDLSCYRNINKEAIGRQMDIILGAAAQWQGNDPMHLEMWPAWMLQKTGGDDESDWRERWAKAGGQIFIPLTDGRNSNWEETGMIALKSDPIWKQLGDRSLFPDALGIDHPPFYPGSGLSWKAVERIEAITLGLLSPDLSEERTKTLVKLHVESKKAIADILDKSIRERNAEYARRKSPEALAAKYQEQTEWYGIQNLSINASVLVKTAAQNNEELSSLEKQFRACLDLERMKTNPKVEASLRRALGHIEDTRGRFENAIEEYRIALALDPKVGCKREFERLQKQQS